MSEGNRKTRRALLKSAPLVIAAAAVPVASSANELPVDKVNRLASELSRALDDFAGATMHAEIHPSTKQAWPIRFSVSHFDIADPLKDAIQAYRDGIARYMAVPEGELNRENEDAIVEQCYGAEDRALCNWNRPATTREGAIEALKFMDEQRVFVDAFGEPMRKAVLGYLESLA